MIKMKNVAYELVSLSAKGAASAADNLDAQQVPITGFVTAVLCQCGVVGTDGTGSPTQDLLVDIKKNGTSIVGTTKITFTHTALAVNPNSYGSLVGAAPIAVSVGDVLSLQITQILNGTSPTQPLNVTVFLRIERARGGGNPAQVITGALEV